MTDNKRYENVLKKYTKKFDKYINSEEFVWFDHSSLTKFILLYLKESAKMYRKCGCCKGSDKIASQMNKAYKMLKFASKYDEIQIFRDVNEMSLTERIRNGTVFRPGKTADERIKSIYRQHSNAYVIAFEYIGKHITGWWD